MTLPPLQGFSSRKTDFHFHQFLSNFLRYSFSNLLSSYPYKIFTVYFPGNSPLLKSFSSILSDFSCLLFQHSFFPQIPPLLPLHFLDLPLSHVLCSTVNPFHHTKYFSTPLIFLLFKIFSTSYSLTSLTSIGFASSLFCPSTCSLYCTI